MILPAELKDQIQSNGQGRGQILATSVSNHRLDVSTETDQPMILVLAQAHGGLSCFFLPRILPDGTLSHEVSTAIIGLLGPLTAAVDRMGVMLDARFAAWLKR